MICSRCIGDNCEECLNLYNFRMEKRPTPTKTWCDCHHKTGIYISPEFCKHGKWDNESEKCPSCGKDMQLDERNDFPVESGLEREFSPEETSVSEVRGMSATDEG